jgi:hypothetical protein
MFDRKSIQRISNTVRTVERETYTSIGQKQGRIIRKSKKGGSRSIEYVSELPQPPEKEGEVKEVFWCDESLGMVILGEPGTGDNQIWTIMYPQRRWTPSQNYTVNNGIPVGSSE